jgi:arylsulfatase A-like enzyme
MRHLLFRLALGGLLPSLLLSAVPVAAEDSRPNILWLVAEDINPHLGCYGDTNAVTPNLDRFAAGSLRYKNCWSTAPVCAPARTALITGVYPTRLGAEHMRSLVRIPSFIRLYPELLREAGYYCSNNNKEDYNVQSAGKVWDESSNRAHWRNRKPGQPFFAVFNFNATHESQIRRRPHRLEHDPAKVRVPAYHPDTAEVRHDWAQYYDNLTEMDRLVAQRLEELEAAGLAEDTVVFFYGDNGSGMPRSKRWPYNSGLNVPLIVRVPARFRHLAPPEYQPGAASGRLVGFVDFAPTLLSLVGVKPPEWMQGQAFMGRFPAPAPKYLFGFRGRMDERCDLVRSARNERFVYIRNYLPHLVYGQHIDYMFQTPTTRVWKQLFDEGKLQPPQTCFWQTKPPEELYDLQADPDEVRNLADSPAHEGVLRELRGALREHLLDIRDTGFLTEAERHRRLQGRTAYELAARPGDYPLERILATAELAASFEQAGVPRLREALGDSDSGVRYWAVMGLLIRGSNTVAAAVRDLRPRLEDSSPSVRVAAAQALGLYGTGEDLGAALRALEQLAPPDKNGAFVSLEALAAIEALGEKARPLYPILRAMPSEDPNTVERSRTYTGRLLAHLLGTDAGEGGGVPARNQAAPKINQ